MKQRKKVLIVDEEVDLSLLMKTYFLRKNYEVYMAHNFEDCLAQAKEQQPNFIFIEVAMCQNPREDLKRLEAVAPTAEIHSIYSNIPGRY